MQLPVSFHCSKAISDIDVLTDYMGDIFGPLADCYKALPGSLQHFILSLSRQAGCLYDVKTCHH